MKAEIHPDYKETTIQCTCGALYQTRSTVNDLRIGICGACHPFFTGEQRFVDTAGRVDKFAQRYGSSQARRADKPRRDVEPQKPRKKKDEEAAEPAEWGDDAPTPAEAMETAAEAAAEAKADSPAAETVEEPQSAPDGEAAEATVEDAEAAAAPEEQATES